MFHTIEEIDDVLIGALLRKGEGADLDYKVEEYKFERANDYEKAELLKDILALANSEKAGNAFLLLGVDETETPAKAVGSAGRLNDASLQQFVKSKLERTLLFKYQPYRYGDVEIGIIQIPKQMRPFVARKRFGGVDPDSGKERYVEAGMVYYRSGSSTTSTSDAATISAFVASDLREARSRPFLSLQFCDPVTHIPIGVHADYEIETPGYDVNKIPLQRAGYMSALMNANYYREAIEYFRFDACHARVAFAIRNTGSIARNVSVEIAFPAEITVVDSFPQMPERQSVLGVTEIEFVKTLTKRGDRQIVRLTEKSVQPGATQVFEDLIAIRAKESMSNKVLDYAIQCDELHRETGVLSVSLKVSSVEFDVGKMVAAIDSSDRE